MRIIEPHIHMIARTTADYERMALMHTAACVEPAFWAGYDRPSAQAFYDYFTHLTTFGKGESVDPRGTMMARIAEVQDQYRNLLFDWAKEFIGYFGLNRRK